MLRHLRKDSRFQASLQFVIDYLQSSNIHGLKQLARADTHCAEFIFWLCILVMAMYCQTSLSVLLKEFYDNKNVGIESDVDYVSFLSTIPAFTFCNKPVLDINRTEEFMRSVLKESPETFKVHKQKMRTEKFLKILLSTTIASRAEYSINNYNIFTNQYMQLIYNLSEKYHVLMNGVQSQKIMTDLGICYSFNSQLIEAVDTRHFGDIEARLNGQKLPTQHFDFYNKYPMKFEFSFNFTTEVKMFVHHPYEVPTTWSKPYIIFKSGEKLKASLFLNEIVMFKDYARSVTIKNRRCRTYKESTLAMFPSVYSHNLCLMNCRAQHAIRVCGCVPHFYANPELLKVNSRTTICSPIGLNCLAHYGYIMQNLLGDETLDGDDLDKHDFKCYCLPNCVDMTTKLFGEITPSIENTYDLVVTIDTPPDVQYRRRIYFTKSDFSISLGSAISLLFGCSLLSFVELCYYFSLRLFWFRRGYYGNTKDV